MTQFKKSAVFTIVLGSIAHDSVVKCQCFDVSRQDIVG
jgi:hypothetical protein